MTDPQQSTSEQPKLQYGNFGLRFLAWLLDEIILGTIIWFLVLPILALIGLSTFSLRELEIHREEELIPWFIAMGSLVFGLVIIEFVSGWLYFALFQSGPRQATPGKMIVGVKVTDMEGNRIDFTKATIRYFSKIISGIILMIGYLIAAFTEKRQALHDLLAGTLVLKR